ncbi:MAG: MiaB/RimO family radical SAM methylthiotransferase [Patescibacteria group bacterium]
MVLKYYIKTFGCQQNVADSERIASYFVASGMKPALGTYDANYVVINTCMIRHSAQNRVNGLVHNLNKIKQKKIQNGKIYKIIVTGCMTGMAVRDKTGVFLQLLKKQMPEVDKFMAIDEIGFGFEPLRTEAKSASVPITNGCNNFCSYCVVPFTRGREVSRPYDEILRECLNLKKRGFENITLLGQNVNSYGSDIVLGKPVTETYFRKTQKNSSFKLKGVTVKPIYVRHLGKIRIPTLFPFLLDDVACIGFKRVDFISSNPWDFSNALIDVIVKNKNITRTIHLPMQSGDDSVLKRMNRWYTAKQYLALINKLRARIPNLKITTDIIVGFCGETEKEFENTVNLIKQVNFDKAYIAMYSQRPYTHATKHMKDDIPYNTKKKRWEILENLIYKSKHKQLPI